jgi:ThiF family
VLSELESLEDLRVLLERNYSLSIIGAHIVVNDVFYLDAGGQLQKGSLAAPLNQPTPTTLGPPVNHQMYWSGSNPCYIDGTQIPSLGNIQADLKLGDRVYNRHFSNKPPEGFPSYALLIEHYVALTSSPVQERYGVTPLTGAVYEVPPEQSPFKVRDTFSARSELTELNRRLADDHIAIIGLGGSGSFILDFMVKTPVYSIDAYDFDVFEVHNGFRSPGEIPFEFFGCPKTDLYRKKYESFRHRLNFHKKRIGCNDASLFADISFVFVCIDDGESRAEICTLLMKLKIPFVDVGMGVEQEAGKLDGLIRATLFTADTAEKAINEVPLDKRPGLGGYRTFVQIAELNALNAAMAVIRYKQLRNFYTDDENYYQSLFSLGSSNWVGEA